MSGPGPYRDIYDAPPDNIAVINTRLHALEKHAQVTRSWKLAAITFAALFSIVGGMLAAAVRDGKASCRDELVGAPADALTVRCPYREQSSKLEGGFLHCSCR